MSVLQGSCILDWIAAGQLCAFSRKQSQPPPCFAVLLVNRIVAIAVHTISNHCHNSPMHLKIAQATSFAIGPKNPPIATFGATCLERQKRTNFGQIGCSLEKFGQFGTFWGCGLSNSAVLRRPVPHIVFLCRKNPHENIQKHADSGRNLGGIFSPQRQIHLFLPLDEVLLLQQWSKIDAHLTNCANVCVCVFFVLLDGGQVRNIRSNGCVFLEPQEGFRT